MRLHAARLVLEEDQAVVYTTLGNGMYYHAEEPDSLVFPLVCIDTVVFIL